MTKILGINAYHADASASLVIDGKVVVAIEEERLCRIKHWAGFPKLAIKTCLESQNLTISDIDHIAINSSPKANLFKKYQYTILKRPDINFILEKLEKKLQRMNIQEEIVQLFPKNTIKAKFHFINHHLAHLASAFYVSPFNSATVVSVDGFGDFSSTAIGYGKSHKIKIKKQVFFPHSLGIFYTALTQYLGFPKYGDEYKIMGLAPYGKPKYLDEMREIVKIYKDGSFKLNLKYFTHTSSGAPHTWDGGEPLIKDLFSNKIIELLGPQRTKNTTLLNKHKDLANSIQAMYEEAFFNIINSFAPYDSSDNLCIAGGCGANSVANGKITSRTKFNKVYIHPAPGDAGGALGAALEVWHKLEKVRCVPMRTAYLGPKNSIDFINNFFKEDETLKLLSESNSKILKLGDSILSNENKLLDLIAEALSEGKVIGWFEGEMEWGPRALGHRSILGDPRKANMKDILNLKIKRRESFRPFAPAILKEKVSDWFNINSEYDLDVPFMMKVYPIYPEKRELIPAVCHIDGSGRLQTVTDKDNGRFYRLIKKFYKKTGVPIVLNTSFNENEPIVFSIKEALDCYLRTKMDYLVIENHIIFRV